MKVRLIKGKRMKRKEAERINELFLSMKAPDRTELQKEADDFIKHLKAKRAGEEYEKS